MHALVGLMRRFAFDWLNRAAVGACAEVLGPGYSILIGGHTLTGRDDAYIPGTLAQLHRFPGVLVTVQELFTNGEQVAMRFTEHGPSRADGMAPAAWTGIGLFWWDGARLVRNITEEDYDSRRHQLAQRASDPVEGSAPAPWAATPLDPNPAAESAVRIWLEKRDLSTMLPDDGWTGRPTPALLQVTDVQVAELFSAGDSVAFHVIQTGRYLGGLPDTDDSIGRSARQSAVGMVQVGAGGTITGRVVRDRVGPRRAVRRQ